MLTLLLALINAKYKHDYEGLFFFTFIIDLVLLNTVYSLVVGI